MALSLRKGRDPFLHIEMPKTGTTWLRHALKVMQIPYVIAEPAPNNCPRHAAPQDYDWNGAMTVTVRDPVTWVESMWRSHRGKGECMFKAWRTYHHRPMFPMGESFSEWLQGLLDNHPTFIDDYYELMITPVHPAHRICFNFYEEQLSDVYGWDLARMQQVNLQNVSRQWSCDWSPELLEQFTAQTKHATELYIGTCP